MSFFSSVPASNKMKVVFLSAALQPVTSSSLFLFMFPFLPLGSKSATFPMKATCQTFFPGPGPSLVASWPRFLLSSLAGTKDGTWRLFNVPVKMGTPRYLRKKTQKYSRDPSPSPTSHETQGGLPPPNVAWGVTSDCGGKALGSVSPAASVTILKYCWDRGPQEPLMLNVSCTLLPGDQSIKQQTQPDYSPAWGPPETPTPSLPGRLLEISSCSPPQTHLPPPPPSPPSPCSGPTASSNLLTITPSPLPLSQHAGPCRANLHPLDPHVRPCWAPHSLPQAQHTSLFAPSPPHHCHGPGVGRVSPAGWGLPTFDCYRSAHTWWVFAGICWVCE